MQKQQEITNNDAKQWIKNHYQEILSLSKPLSKISSNIEELEKSELLQKQNQYQNQSYTINIYTPKTEKQIRERYYNRLNIIKTTQQIYQPRKRHQNLFIFDWDDTFLCTSFYNYHNQNIPNQYQQLLQKLDLVSETLLKKFIQFQGPIYIITNASKGWVQYSSKLYLPLVHNLIKKENIQIISARSLFSSQYSEQYKWKIQAFKSILHCFDTSIITNLIVMGDSDFQIKAGEQFGRNFQEIMVKTIKLKQNPSLSELIKQQQLISSKITGIYSTPKKLAIKLNKKQPQKKNQQE